MQRSMAIIVTSGPSSGMKNPPKKLKFSQFLPGFQALPLLFLRNSYLSKTFDNNIWKYCPTTCFSRFIEIKVIRDADRANQDYTHLVIEIITIADSL